MKKISRFAVNTAICLILLPGMSPAQAQDQGEDSFTIIETAEPPRGEASAVYLRFARSKRARAEVLYVTELEGELASGRATQRRIEVDDREPVSLNGYGVVLALLLILGLLFLWLKFGGSGTLLSREPREDQEAGPVPEAWKISEEEMQLDGRSLLERIAAMTNRTEALVLLLRHSLLAGARATQVRFQRSDTERSAMERLPKSWKNHGDLSELLQETELAHYGGREVSEGDFSRAMEIGRTILGGMKHV